MPIEVFTHQLRNGEIIKFSIWKREITSKTYYFARAAYANSQNYKNLPKHEQENYYGANVIFGKQQTIFYNNAYDLKRDLVVFYGSKWWIAEA